MVGQISWNVNILDMNYIFYVYFAEFIDGMSQFSVKGDKKSKLRCK